MRAIVLGATGLVGAELVEQLLAKESVSEVRTIVRRPSGRRHEKLIEKIVDFEELALVGEFIRGDVLFSALGTTFKAAGSQEAQYRVDYSYQLEVAQLARRGGVETLVLVSALGADPRAAIFYSRMKGELEVEVRALGFPRLRILRPGFLDGPRKEHRPGEKAALLVLRHVPNWDSLAKVRPILASTVARAGILAAEDETEGVLVLEPKDIFLAET